jgi:DNA modification methylase
LRSDIIWHKPNPMPESVRDRPTKAHEYVFLLTKSSRYYYDAEAILEPASEATHARFDLNGQPQAGHPRIVGVGAKARPRKAAPNGVGIKNNASFDAAMAVMPTLRNKRSVWTIATDGFSDAHFATFPPALIEPCIKAGCPVGGTVLDPFGGSGTTGLVADRLQRNAILIELNPKYAAMAHRRIHADAPLLSSVVAA